MKVVVFPAVPQRWVPERSKSLPHFFSALPFLINFISDPCPGTSVDKDGETYRAGNSLFWLSQLAFMNLGKSGYHSYYSFTDEFF